MTGAIPSAIIILAAAVMVAPLVDDDVLEPSVANEVGHALERVPAGAEKGSCELLPFATNGLSETAIAIRLVSTQGRDGRWRCGTNDVTAAAVKLLMKASGVEP